jgi:hypothetical protein
MGGREGGGGGDVGHYTSTLTVQGARCSRHAGLSSGPMNMSLKEAGGQQCGASWRRGGVLKPGGSCRLSTCTCVDTVIATRSGRGVRCKCVHTVIARKVSEVSEACVGVGEGVKSDIQCRRQGAQGIQG